MTLLALPILLIDNIPRTDANASSVTVVAAAGTSSAPWTLAAVVSTVPPSSAEPTTTTPPSTAAPTPTSTAAPHRDPVPAPTTTVRRITTTTTVPAAPPTTHPPTPSTVAASAGSETGDATWYDYRPGECAHKTIAKGTVVRITNLENGASTSCVVTDRGPYGDSRIIDLDRGTFARIADPAEGVIRVTISW